MREGGKKMNGFKLLTILAVIAILMLAGCERKVVNEVVENNNPYTPVTCFNCHTYDIDLGTEVKLAIRQWENSQHGSGENMRSSGSCARCHTTEGFVEEITDVELTSGAFNAVGCFACHDPHENGDFRLRTTAAVELGNGATYNRGVSNLCANCHQGRRNVDTYVVDSVRLSGHFGPHHGPQADMLIGENAYEYSGYDYDTDSWHTTGVDNGCINCHFDVTSAYELGGHTFEMGPVDDENTDACNVDGCHVSVTEIDDFDRVTDNDFDGDGDDTEGVQTEIDDLMAELEGLLATAGLIEWIAEDNAWEPTDRLVVPDADSTGAVFNWGFVYEDKSHGIHNTRYAVDLLQSSINYMTVGDPNGVSKPETGLIVVH